jgi:iron complex transport system substrate-binding protein
LIYKVLLFILFSTSLLAQERIIPLAPAINEILYALGKGDEIVANTTYATYPKEAKSKPKVGGYFSVSLEKILSHRPTLVLMQRNNLALKPKLQKLGINTETIYISSLNDIKAGIKKIGKLTHSKKRATELTNEIDKAIARTQGIIKDKKILIVFGVVFDLKREVYVSGNQLYFADIIRASGNQNAFLQKHIKQPTLSYEGIVKLNPDIIYILAHRIQGCDKKELIAPWLKLPINAAKSQTIYITTKKYAGMPSQRVTQYINDFKEVLEDAKEKFQNGSNSSTIK